MGGTNQDGGTSSFFVNLTSNTFLDADFTVFAAIPDMTVVNQIMALMTDRPHDRPDVRRRPRQPGVHRRAGAGQRLSGVHQAARS